MKIFLTGATGFVGSHMAARLVADGHRVRALVRDRYAASLKLPGSIDLVPGDLFTGGGLAEGIAGCEAVIHLVGIILERHGNTFERAHVVSTRNLLDIAKQMKVRRWIQISAVGARPDGITRYQTTKWQAEELVRGSGLEFSILRPSIIFGPRDGFVSEMVEIMYDVPFVRPVPGNGQYRFRPVYIDTVVECFMQALTLKAGLGKSIDLVGPEELTLAQMLQDIADCVGVKKPGVKVPMPLMFLNAAMLSVLPKPPVTIDQLRMLQEGSVADPEPMMATFKVNPVGFREGLNRYLCQQAQAR